jgi:hypothetical protein
LARHEGDGGFAHAIGHLKTGKGLNATTDRTDVDDFQRVITDSVLH